MPGFLLVRAASQGIFPLLLTSMLRALLELSRVSNLPTVWTNVLAAWIIASGADWQWTPALGWLLLGASLIYSAGMILNDACDAAWDRKHRPERPIPSGRIGLKTVWFISLAGLAIGYALMVFAGGASWKITALLVAAVVAYDVYHKPWAGSVIIMGACRTLLYLAAGSASSEVFDDIIKAPVLYVGSLSLGSYIIGLSLIARSEISAIEPDRAKFWSGLSLLCLPLLDVFGVVLLRFVLSGDRDHSLFLDLASIPFWVASEPINLVAPLLLLGLMYLAVEIMSKPPPSNVGKAVGWLLAGIPIVDAIIVSPFSLPTALCFCALPPFLRLWQRWVTAT